MRVACRVTFVKFCEQNFSSNFKLKWKWFLSLSLTWIRLPPRHARGFLGEPRARNLMQRLAVRLMSTARKPGVAPPSELAAFIIRAGVHLAVVDARAADAASEPSSSIGPLAPSASRPRAVSAPLDRATGALPLEAIPAAWVEAAGGRANLFVITHCGGGGRGQKAKDFLLKNGFVHVLNGGGPEDAECWAEFATR